MPIYLHAYLSTCLFIYMPIYLMPIYLMPIYLSAYLSFCLFNIIYLQCCMQIFISGQAAAFPTSSAAFPLIPSDVRRLGNQHPDLLYGANVRSLRKPTLHRGDRRQYHWRP